MKKHVNIPIFIPHLGCPNQCVFCNQRYISGVDKFDPDSVRAIIDEAISTTDADIEREIAFFGGSFTGIDETLMIKLLKIANEYLENGAIDSIRCSTRPDYINEYILDILEEYHVETVELGLQSCSDRVLSVTKRGHSFEDEARACKLIKSRGLSLVGQMMIGLPESSVEDELKTAEFIINSGASGVRIYPTVVFNDTELCNMAKQGEYTPVSLDDAVERTARVLELFIKTDIKVLRIGLCSSDNLSDERSYFAGPNHPALGELVKSKVYYNIIKNELDNLKHFSDRKIVISVPAGETSKVIGQKKENKIRLMQDFCIDDIIIREDKSLSEYNIRILR